MTRPAFPRRFWVRVFTLFVAGNETRIITLLIMRATTTEVQIVNETYPIRVFSDMNVYSSGLCVSWDRFYPDTAGGAWNPKGLLNNGEGLL